MPKTDTESKAVAASISKEPGRGSKAAAVPMVDVLRHIEAEQNLCAHAQRLADLISFANDARNSSVPDVLVSLSNDLAKGAD